MKFGLFSDLHLDIMQDGERRLHAFLEDARKADVDFVIHGGDFCYPKETTHTECPSDRLPVNLRNAMDIPTDVNKIELLHEYVSFEKPHYFVLGNHEFDFCSKKETMALYGMDAANYSFTMGGWDFIVLDGNFYCDEKGNYHDYYYGDYFGTDNLPFVHPEQLEWLKDCLASGTNPVVVFSHQPIYGSPRSFRNGSEIQSILEQSRRVKLCISGHLHIDRLFRKKGIAYYYMNSISNYWAGTPWAQKRFDEETERKYPNLRYTFPYKDPVYAIVTLDDKGATIQGHSGSFIKPGPRTLGYPQTLTATVKNRYIKFED